jgi:oxygen-independent coproporphyrinogen-3 oxidase
MAATLMAQPRSCNQTAGRFSDFDWPFGYKDLVLSMAASPPVTSLYVHVPFCARKCSYCAFYSEASDGELVNRYITALIREMEWVAEDLRPRTVFFGGGTPSLLNLKQWERVLVAMDRFGLLGAEEWTVECNPATVSLEKARLLKCGGVNRISMGVQSLNEGLLDRLGRVHSREMVFKSFEVLRRTGFTNINLDLMFGIPGQTLEIWRDTLTEIFSMNSEHLSSYEVIYEEDTALYEQLRAGEFEVDEDLACAMYEELVQRAAGAGFEQYEVANFARAGAGLETTLPQDTVGPSPTDSLVPVRACQHNVNYWRGGSFYGLGPSATSYVRGVRTKNHANTKLYCEQIEKGKRPVESSEELPSLRRAGETAAFGLRMIAGWPFEEFWRVTGHDLRQGWAGEMNQLARQGWGEHKPGRFHLTPRGLRFADAAAQLFLR